MLSKIATAGQNGQFRTPRHIIQLMVEMTDPGPGDEICDPACGTAGFLVAAAEYVQREHRRGPARAQPAASTSTTACSTASTSTRTMLRIASMNMLLHEVEQPDIRYRDSLAQNVADEAERYSLVLANPPFAGSLDYETTAEDLLKVVKTKKTELLFLALFLRLLKPGGRAAVIVPDGVLFGSTKAHVGLRKILVEDHKLDAIVKLPAACSSRTRGSQLPSSSSRRRTRAAPTTSGSTTSPPTASASTTSAPRNWPRKSTGPRPQMPLDEADHAKNNLPDVLARWARRDGSELDRPRTDQSFCRPQGRHRRPGLRPQPQPLQGDRPRRGRAPLPSRHHRRAGIA